MLQLLKPLAIGALILLGAPVMAQETTTDVEAVAPANDAVAVGTPYIRETFGDWALRCLVAREGDTDPCELFQRLNDNDGNSVAEFRILALPSSFDATAGVTIIAPLKTLLTEHLQISVDGSDTRSYPFSFCNSEGCAVQIGFSAEDVDELKRGSKATIRLVPAAAPENQVILDVSLSGFTAAYEASIQ